MNYKVKSALITTCCFAISIWWLGLHNYSMDEQSYSRDECAQDLCKIHTDLADRAARRGDLEAAIKNYSIALGYHRNELILYNKLSLCYAAQGKSEKALEAYFQAMHLQDELNKSLPADEKPTPALQSLITTSHKLNMVMVWHGSIHEALLSPMGKAPRA
jgi:tetratricopeptide (TPR) repeat protein